MIAWTVDFANTTLKHNSEQNCVRNRSMHISPHVSNCPNTVVSEVMFVQTFCNQDSMPCLMPPKTDSNQVQISADEGPLHKVSELYMDINVL